MRMHQSQNGTLDYNKHLHKHQPRKTSFGLSIFLWLHVRFSAADTGADNKFTHFAHFGMMKTLFSKLFTTIYSLRSLLSLRFSSLTSLTLGRCPVTCPDKFRVRTVSKVSDVSEVL